jgi:hypothetical protein
VSTNSPVNRKAAYFRIDVSDRVCHRISGIVGRKEIYRCPGPRGILFVSIAPAAEKQKVFDGFKHDAGVTRVHTRRDVSEGLAEASRILGVS